MLERPSPLFDDSFRFPTRHDIGGRLMGGAALFGIGWELLGLCPGPIFAALPGAHPIVLVLAAAMLGSMVTCQAVSRSRARPPADR